MSIDITYANILLYMMIFVRLAGMLGFNPIFSRNGVPARVRVGLIFFLTLVIVPLQQPHVAENIYRMNAFQYAFSLMLELGIGAILGYVFQVFYLLLFFVGDLVDTDIGLSMAKSFDPGTNIQAGFTGTLFTLVFSLYIFVSGSHLALLKIFTDTFTAIEPGSFQLSVSIISFVIRLFAQVFVLVLRLFAPFMVAEFVLQASMGILMKFIPQISVFVINFQLKVGLGLLMLFTFAPFVGEFISTYIDTLLDTLLNAVDMMTVGGTG